MKKYKVDRKEQIDWTFDENNAYRLARMIRGYYAHLGHTIKTEVLTEQFDGVKMYVVRSNIRFKPLE